MDELFDFLIKKDVEYKINQPMSQYTSVRIGGRASVIAFPSTEDQLVDLVRYLFASGTRYKVIGRMTNLLPCDCEYRGVLISTKLLNRFEINGSVASAECGVPVRTLIERMAHLGLGGAEGLCGIPGTLGGAIISNAGAYGAQTADIIKNVSVYSVSHDSKENYACDELGFSYRKSVFLRSSDAVILSARLEFVPRDSAIILSELGKIRRRRALAQPIECASLGSVFKRVDDRSAAEIIDRCGLKGLRVGNAQVSLKHAGFIVNLGGATAAEYLELVSSIKRTVYEKCGIVLEEEIESI